MGNISVEEARRLSTNALRRAGMDSYEAEVITDILILGHQTWMKWPCQEYVLTDSMPGPRYVHPHAEAVLPGEIHSGMEYILPTGDILNRRRSALLKYLSNMVIPPDILVNGTLEHCHLIFPGKVRAGIRTGIL